MMHNHAFWRAVHSIAHPITIGAVITLLLNDHLLRYVSPSWITGKLGDFTWLIFAPLICALIVSWMVPRRVPKHERMVGLLSFGFIGLWFALAKTVPMVHELTLDALEIIVGWRGTLRLDVTDLLTLPALFIGWQVWSRASNAPLKLPSRVWWVAGLGIFGTLATSPSYIPVLVGINQVCMMRHQLLVAYESLAIGYTEPFHSEMIVATSQSPQKRIAGFSSDGGLTWTMPSTVESFGIIEVDASNCSSAQMPLVDPKDAHIQYRWIPEKSIQRSTDGGRSWKTINELEIYGQEVYDHFRNHWKVEHYDQTQLPSPQQGLIDRRTGNVLFPMGWDGILVLTPDNQWHWASVGNYKLESLSLQNVGNVLFWEFWTGVLFAILVILHSWAFTYQTGVFEKFLIGASWFLWLVIVMVCLPRWHFNGDKASMLVIAFLVVLLLQVGIMALYDFLEKPRQCLPPVALVALGCYVAYLFPYSLWALGRIPEYGSAIVLMIILSLCAALSGQVYLMSVLPFGKEGKKKKRSEDAAGVESLFYDENDNVH